ncbi:sensor histidine kinase [Salinigranum rubrum]|uniref:sensor histidine kinase n=1 Tax=Salinigranum rubrum TaxID=755307 RepID=UPI001C1FF0FC|nr:HAMP domain-containing sensor histidine kinase [Salinigranum rubrum]
MLGRVNYSGLVVAGVGFFLTRFTVTLAVYDDPVQFYLAGVVPLALGLGLAAFGVALTVADVEPSLVRTTARWCVVGAGAMFVLVVLTLLGSTGGDVDLASAGSQTYFANFLIGGSVGGTFTGLYAARTHGHRDELVRQTNRLELLNRLLRHEVLNAVAVIRGYATLQGDDHPTAGAVIERRSDAIERTIREVKYLTRTETRGRAADGSVALEPCLTASVDGVRTRHPHADISVTADDEALAARVRAGDRLQHVFDNLVENAVVHTSREAPTVEVSVSVTGTAVRVSVADDGPGLPERQRELVETGDIGEFDDPRSGFGLTVSRFLVESYGGTMGVDVDREGTTITVVLRRVDVDETGLGALQADAGVRPAIPHLVVTLVAALVAGGLYGVAAELLGGRSPQSACSTASPTRSWGGTPTSSTASCSRSGSPASSRCSRRAFATTSRRTPRSVSRGAWSSGWSPRASSRPSGSASSASRHPSRTSPSRLSRHTSSGARRSACAPRGATRTSRPGWPDSVGGRPTSRDGRRSTARSRRRGRR